MWCVVKSAPVRTAPRLDADIVGTLRFKQLVYIHFSRQTTNGMIECDSIVQNHKPNYRIIGWVPIKGLCKDRIEDYAGLYYQNLTGKRVPCTLNYYSRDVYTWILPGDVVQVIAVTGNWFLTEKGWTRAKWLTKCRDIFDQECMDTLIYNVLAQAVKDYCNAVRKIKQKKYGSDDGFVTCMSYISNVEHWFLSKTYREMFDPVPGDERLRDLMQKMEIDKEWMREQRLKAERIKALR